MESNFSKAYIIGSGELPLAVAHTMSRYLEDIIILEVKLTEGSFLEKKCAQEDLNYNALPKKDITGLLLEEKTKSLIVSASSTYLIPDSIISKDNFFIINWHNALLPAHKGRNAECWAIFEGDKETGITWHMLTSDVDAGDIIIQRTIPIGDDETSLGLFKKQIEAGEETFEEIAPLIVKGEVQTSPQNKSVESVMHYSKDIPNEGLLDPSWGYEKTSCFLRSMDYGAFKLLGDSMVTVDGEVYCFRKYDLNGDPGLPEGFDGTNLVLKKNGKTIILKKLKKD